MPKKALSLAIKVTSKRVLALQFIFILRNHLIWQVFTQAYGDKYTQWLSTFLFLVLSQCRNGKHNKCLAPKANKELFSKLLQKVLLSLIWLLGKEVFISLPLSGLPKAVLKKQNKSHCCNSPCSTFGHKLWTSSTKMLPKSIWIWNILSASWESESRMSQSLALI